MLLTWFRSFFFWLWVNHFRLICVHLVLVYHSAQLIHTWSGFSHLLRVMISESRILFHFILVLLSSNLMKQLTYNVGIISLIRTFLVWIFSWSDFLKVTGTDASCVLYIICSQFIVHNLWASHALFCQLRLVCCIVGITLCRFTLHLPLFVFGSIW